MKRLFVAVDPDAATRAAIDGISQSLRSGLPRASWVAADRLHLTLEFLGAVEANVEERVCAGLVQAIPMPRFELSFNGLGFFPASGRPRVLWLGVGEGLERMRRLHSIVRDRVGASEAARSIFTPHLTLARFRERVARSHVNRIETVKAVAGPCSIDRVTLYESRLSPRGSVYVPLAVAPLGV